METILGTLLNTMVSVNKTMKPIIVVLLGLIVSCSNDDTVKLVLENSVFVTVFPEERPIKTSEEIELDIGNYSLISIALKDSLLMLSAIGREYLAYVYDVRGMSYLGGFFRIGNGPSEFLHPFHFVNARVYSDGESIMADIPNPGGANVLRWNVSKSIIKKETVSESSPLPLESPASHSALWKILDDSLVFCRAVSEDWTRLEREVYARNELQHIEAFTILNRAAIPSTRFNLLSGCPVYDAQFGVLADASISTNVINFVALDNSFSKSVIVGPEAVSLQEAERYCVRHRGEYKQYFSGEASSDGLCAFLYSADSKDYSILFFDWHGEPKLKVNLPHPATEFCFDSSKHVIYALDSENEKIYKYEY